MRNFYITCKVTFLFLFCITGMEAQIKIFPNGNLKVGNISNTPASILTVGNTTGNTGCATFILTPYVPSSTMYGLITYVNPTDMDYSGQAIYGHSYFNYGGGNSRYIGVCGYAYQSTAVNYGKSYGVRGIAGNAANGYNYGVIGWLSGTRNGAAVLGTLNSGDICLNDRYAGYFDGKMYINGSTQISGTTQIGGLTQFNNKVGIQIYPFYDLDVWGDIHCYGQWVGSDSTLKHNIKKIDNEKINLLYNLRAVSFYYNIPVEKNKNELINKKKTITTDTGLIQVLTTDTVVRTKFSTADNLSYGFIAQEVEKIYPNVVSTDDKGIKSINYNYFIPLIVEALKAQNKRIDTLILRNDTLKQQNDFLKMQIGRCCEKNLLKSMTSLTDNNTDGAILYQNMPNPFNEKTEIRYLLPENTISAMICIYDLQGKQLKCYNISGKGENSITINGGELAAGMYLYTLIVNGTEVDTKRMILTE